MLLLCCVHAITNSCYSTQFALYVLHYRSQSCGRGSTAVIKGCVPVLPTVPRPRTLIPSVLSGNVMRVDTILDHIKKRIDAIPKDDDGTGQVPDPGNSKLVPECDATPQAEASCPDSIAASELTPGALMSQSSSESGVSQDEEMPEVADVQHSDSSTLNSSDRGLESPTLVASLQDVPCGAIVVREGSDISEPQKKRMRFSSPSKPAGTDVPPSEPESLMPESFLVNLSSGPVNELEHQEEPSGSVPPALIEIDIDSEMQVLKKQDATSTFKATTESHPSCVNSARYQYCSVVLTIIQPPLTGKMKN